MISRKWEHIKLKNSGVEYEVNVGFPSESRQDYISKDKYDFVAYLLFEDNSNISFHERRGVFVGTTYSRLFNVNAVPAALSGKLLAYRMIVHRKSLEKGDLAI